MDEEDFARRIATTSKPLGRWPVKELQPIVELQSSQRLPLPNADDRPPALKVGSQF
jgi:hypothetical protein